MTGLIGQVGLGRRDGGNGGDGGDGKGSRGGDLASGGIGLHAKTCTGRSGLGMTSLIDGVGFGRRDGGDIRDSGGNSAMVVSEEVCGGMVVAESVPAIVRVFGSHPG